MAYIFPDGQKMIKFQCTCGRYYAKPRKPNAPAYQVEKGCLERGKEMR